MTRLTLALMFILFAGFLFMYLTLRKVLYILSGGCL